MIPLAEPLVGGNEWDYVRECLDSGWLSSSGKFVDRFECEFAARLGVDSAVAVASGTAALHLALLAVGVQPGDEVLVSTLSFIAPANAIRYVGAQPVFVDSDPETWQMDVARAVEFLDSCGSSVRGVINPKSGRRIAAILPVHILGHPVDMDPLLATARRLGLPVIEDATESLGAQYRGRKVGTLGDVACFSFNGNKLITTGGGGMVVSRDRAILDRVRYLSTQAKDDPIEYVHEAVGYNYRLTNVQAAIGCAQLERLDEFIRAKLTIARRYMDALGNRRAFSVMPAASWATPVFWLYTTLVEGGSRRLMQRLGEEQIQTRPLWHCLHRNTPYSGNQVLGGAVAERLQRDALSLPCSAGLSAPEQDRVIEALYRLVE